MLKGIENLERAVRESSAMGSGDWINKLRIGDGDIACVRFVTDKDDLIRAKFHDVEKTTPKGTFKVPVYCTKEDTGVCANCSAGNIPHNTINLWAWVHYILHKNQNPNIQTGSTEGIWQQIKQGKTVLYKEDVNKFLLFQTKYGQAGRYRQLFIDYAKEYETLCDRDYTWSRIGKSTDTNYNLMPKKESEMSVEIAKAADKLPDLGEVVCGKIRSFGQAKEAGKEESETENTEDDEKLF